MTTKNLLSLSLLITLIFGQVTTHQALADSRLPPKSEKAKQVQTIVNKAVSVLAVKGKKAFVEFRKKGSQWFSGDFYLFVCDFQQNTLFNAAFPEREGMNTSQEKDSNGKYYHQELVKMAETHGSGWVDYYFPKPGQTKPSQKWTYVKTIRVNGVPSFVGAGFYP